MVLPLVNMEKLASERVASSSPSGFFSGGFPTLYWTLGLFFCRRSSCLPVLPNLDRSVFRQFSVCSFTKSLQTVCPPSSKSINSNLVFITLMVFVRQLICLTVSLEAPEPNSGQPLHCGNLDFGNVSHAAIFGGLDHTGVHPWLIDFIKYIYSASKNLQFKNFSSEPVHCIHPWV